MGSLQRGILGLVAILSFWSAQLSSTAFPAPVPSSKPRPGADLSLVQLVQPYLPKGAEVFATIKGNFRGVGAMDLAIVYGRKSRPPDMPGHVDAALEIFVKQDSRWKSFWKYSVEPSYPYIGVGAWAAPLDPKKNQDYLGMDVVHGSKASTLKILGWNGAGFHEIPRVGVQFHNCHKPTVMANGDHVIVSDDCGWSLPYLMTVRNDQLVSVSEQYPDFYKPIAKSALAGIQDQTLAPKIRIEIGRREAPAFGLAKLDQEGKEFQDWLAKLEAQEKASQKEVLKGNARRGNSAP